MPDKTFIRITNKDIYETLMEFKEANSKEHSEIIQHQLRTNGDVRVNKWVSRTSLTLIILMMGWLVSFFLGLI